jgi:protein-S-isoprenylcysteine O-methyltransferase Ste14
MQKGFILCFSSWSVCVELLGKTTIHPVLFFSGKFSGYAVWVLFVLSLVHIHTINQLSVGFLRIIACILACLGLVFIVLSLINLGSSTSLGLPVSDTTLKTDGLYRISRNPMYVGFDLLTLSSILYLGNIFVAGAGLYSIVIYHLIIIGEEKFLIGRFSSSYANYKNKVRRYL